MLQQNTTKLLLVCFVFCLFSPAPVSSVNCNQTVYQTYNDLSNCLMSIAYNETVKADTLETLRAIIPSYVFVDSVQQSADPVHIPMSVNLQSSLNVIESTDYTNDAELQQAFASLFAELQDAHTRYTKPLDPYCAASFALPFNFYSRVSGTPQEQKIFLKIRQELLDRYLELYPSFSETSVNGYQVITINGEDAVTAIGKFANSSVGYSKDYSARFNLAVDGYGGDFPPMFTWRNQSLQGIPEQETMVFVVQSSSGVNSSISVNWLGVFDEFYPLNITDVGKVGVHQLEYFEKAFGLDSSRDNEEPEGNPDVYWTVINGDTGVLRIYTFSPSSSEDFIKTVQEAVCYFNENNITRLIIDVSQNGGGSICLGYAVERFLFPDVSPFVGAYDIKASQLFTEFSEAASNQMCQNTTRQLCGVNPEIVGYFTPCAWYDWYSKDQHYDDSWIIPGNTVTRGGIPDSYSSFITQNCDTEFTRWIPSDATRLKLSPQDVIVVSDGLCGSTCSVFSRHLQLNHRVKSVTTGGVLGGQQPSLTSFPGGEVVHLSYILDLAERYGLADSPLVPAPLPTTADFRFAIREIFGWDGISLSSVPQEFTYLPADWQIFYEEPFENRTAIWNAVLPFFSECSETVKLPCVVPNGIGTYLCMNNTASNQCSATVCDPGYELSLNGTCEQCPVGYYSSGFNSGACELCPTVIPENCYFSDSGVASPSCPFICTSCVSCDTSQTQVETLNTVCMETWAFCLLLVAIIVISSSVAAIFSSFVTVRYYTKQRFQKLANESHLQYD